MVMPLTTFKENRRLNICEEGKIFISMFTHAYVCISKHIAQMTLMIQPPRVYIYSGIQIQT